MDKKYSKELIIGEFKILTNEVRRVRKKIGDLEKRILEWKKKGKLEKGNLNQNDIEEIVESLQTLFKEFRIAQRELNRFKAVIIKYGNKTLGEYLRESRKKLGKSQDEVAAELNISKSTISRWENSEMLPSYFNLKKIAKIYGIDINELEKFYAIEKKLKEG